MALYRALSSGSRNNLLLRDQLSDAVAELEQRIQLGGLDVCSYGGLLRRCIELRALEEGRRVDAHIGPAFDTVLGNLLVQLYGTCRSVGEACRAFDRLRKKNKFSWNTLMTAFAQCGQPQRALELFEMMPQVDVISWTLILKIHAQHSGVEQCRCCFEAMPERCDVSWNVLLTANAQDGDCNKVKFVFEKMPLRPAKSWNIVLKAAGDHGDALHAKSLFDGMPERDIVSWNTLLTAGSPAEIELNRVFPLLATVNKKHTEFGKSEWASTGSCLNNKKDININLERSRALMELTCAKMPRHDIVTYNSLLAMYFFRFRDQESAQNLFDSMQASQRNSNTWNTMLGGYARLGDMAAASKTFQQMPERDPESWKIIIAVNIENHLLGSAIKLLCLMDLDGVEPCAVSLTRILNSCADSKRLSEGKLVHSSINHIPHLVSETVMGTSLVNMYGRCGELDEATKIFDELPERDSIAWTAMISSYLENNSLLEGDELFRSLTDRSLVTWNVMMSGCVQSGRNSCCLLILRELLQDGEFDPNEGTYILALEACAGLSKIHLGAFVHRLVSESGFVSNLVVATGLITMYGKCGSLIEARRVFDGIETKDRVCWTAMISAYSQNVSPAEALELFLEFKLQGEDPSLELFTAVLSACTHAGMLEDCRSHFLAFAGDFSLVPGVDQYVCMVDLLGRAGKIKDCEELLHSMPFEPHCVAWTSLMHASGSQGDDHRAREALGICNRFEDSDTLYTPASWRYYSDV